MRVILTTVVKISIQV